MSNLLEIQKRAVLAYVSVLSEAGAVWTPPPTEMKDKIWSRKLREIWPNYTSVKLDERFKDRYAEAKAWCKENAGAHWCNNAGNVWYFRERDLAALFKLTFGGTQHD